MYPLPKRKDNRKEKSGLGKVAFRYKFFFFISILLNSPGFSFLLSFLYNRGGEVVVVWVVVGVVVVDVSMAPHYY
jgi:hypothetical protein